MKKIYFSFTLLFAGASLVNAQTNLTADQAEGLNHAPSQVNVSLAQTYKGPAGVFSPLGCDSLKTTYAGGNGQSGNMFDLTNTSSVTIQVTGVDQMFQSTNADSVAIYYKSGTFVGSEATPAAWTLGGKTLMTPSSSTVPVSVPISLNINIPAGQTFGMYITIQSTTNSVHYTNGLTMGAVYKSENGLDFKEGKGVAYPFGATYPSSGTASRIWNGNIYYCTPLILDLNESEKNSGLAIFPNPSSGELTVKLAEQAVNASLVIKDMTGRTVYSLNNINGTEISVNAENLSQGVYMIQVEGSKGMIATKKIAIH
jgi:hypothetical protein